MPGQRPRGSRGPGCTSLLPPALLVRPPDGLSTSVPEEATDIFSVNPAATCSPEPKEPRCAHGG